MNFINPTSIRRIARGAGLVAVLATFACDDTTGPNDVVGSYEATSFVTTTGGVDRNELASGGFIDLVLDSDGTTSGDFHLAAFGGNPAVDEDLSGTWTLTGSTVRINLDGDLFLEDVDLHADDDRLTIDDTFSGTRIRVTLTRD